MLHDLLTLLHNSTNVTMSLSIIEGSELRGRLVETGVGSKDTTTTLSLIANNSTHGDGVGRDDVVEKECVNQLWFRKNVCGIVKREFEAWHVTR